MSMWHEARRTMPDRDKLRMWIARKLKEANGGPVYAYEDEDTIGAKWLARADRVIAHL